QITEGSIEDKANAAIDKTVAFFHQLGIDTKLSDYTKDYEGTAEEISKRFTTRGWVALGEHKALSPDKVAAIVKMAY
ncbi:MAG: NADH-dependent alcohol dehydrogenase, partial [Winogradskyella sp.]